MPEGLRGVVGDLLVGEVLAAAAVDEALDLLPGGRPRHLFGCGMLGFSQGECGGHGVPAAPELRVRDVLWTWWWWWWWW